MYRKSRSTANVPAKFRLLVPTWGQAQTDTTNLLFKVLMDKLGVTDGPSYFRRLWFWIGACVVLGAVFGAHRNGVEGVIWGALAGIVAPGGLLWLGVILSCVFVYMAVFFAAWAVLLYGLLWLLRQ